MVKKLFKHEFASYIRIWVPIVMIMIGLSLFSCVLSFVTPNLPEDAFIIPLISMFVNFFHIASIVVAFVILSALGVIRFYKNLFSSEGYLSFTLPVSVDQHIIVKIVTAVCVMAATVVVALFSLFLGDPRAFILHARDIFSWIGQDIYPGIGANLYVFALLILVCIILYTVEEYFLYYTCISIGQTFKKNRILGAVAVYFIYQFIIQALGVILVIFALIFESVEIPIFTKVFEFFENHPVGALYTVLSLIIVGLAAVSTVYYCLMRYVIKHKLNLE